MHHTFSICSLAPSPRNSSGEFISPNMYIYIYTCTGTSDFQLIFWAGWGIGWGPTREAAPKIVGPCAKFQSWFSVRTMCLSVRIHLRHQRQNWAHDDLSFTGYPDCASHRDLAATCSLYLCCSLITIFILDSGEALDLAKSCASLHFLLQRRQATNWNWHWIIRS